MRIYFPSYNKAEYVKADAIDKGIRIHSKIGAFVRNIFAKLGLCSEVIKFNFNFMGIEQDMYINKKSFNNWNIRNQTSPITIIQNLWKLKSME